ncbi:Oidioi.mRNA.OKI2018_I69.chr1.g41.t1.cds [Oikopleura dioica]|uniref:Oidioi.mRNA.OKI2018_I69.chr1.g41.t1.cds n=1 Tax=Oikopleura dioica TaxID=34765 RepID=A0ABN7SSX2_OIKDI|nr:Oidioi.mRNA.OKI2018_I69.chr1.g41.t1.cds [Oikopleura dioica]
MVESNFSEPSPDFVCFFITEILPGKPRNTEACCCCSNPFDDRLYQFPVKTDICGYKSGWNELMPISEEDMMIMECTGWNQQQLWAGMKEVQRALDKTYWTSIFCRSLWLVLFVVGWYFAIKDMTSN